MVSTETARMCTHTAEPTVKEPSQMSSPERIFLQRKVKKKIIIRFCKQRGNVGSSNVMNTTIY